MSRVKKQHFVPEFYLKAFCNKKSKIKVFDKIQNKSFQSNINDVAQERGFYDFDGNQEIEKVLSNFEDKWAKTFQRLNFHLVEKPLNVINSEMRYSLASFIFFQMLRTKESRKIGEYLNKESERQLLEKGVSKEQIWLFGLTQEQFDSKRQQLFNLASGLQNDIIKELCDRLWVFWKNNTDVEILTSDNPVIGYIHEERSFNAFEIVFPLSPEYILSVFTRKAFIDYEIADNKVVPVSNSEIIMRFNSLMKQMSHRQILSKGGSFKFHK